MAADVLPAARANMNVEAHLGLSSNDSGMVYSSSVPLRRNDPAAGWITMKFGGTSIGKVPSIIAEDIIRARLAQSSRLVVVCSARSSDTKLDGTTSRLLRAAREAQKLNPEHAEECVREIREDHLQAAETYIRSKTIRARLAEDMGKELDGLLTVLGAVQALGEVTEHTLDKVVSNGENLSCRFMAALLEDRGVDAQFVDLASVVRSSPNKDLDQEFYNQLAGALATEVLKCGNRVPVVTGFFGPIEGGLLKRIGRGYTDLCAALIAVGLQAQELQIWKEVDGIFTANPHKVPTARLLPTISPAEAAELTYYGSEVLHPFLMEQVTRAYIPIRIRNVFNLHNEGTAILPDHLPSRPGSASASGAATPATTAAESTTSLNMRPAYQRTRTPSELNGVGARQRPKRPTAVTVKHNIIVLNVHSNKRTLSHGFFAKIFSILDYAKLSVDLISTSEVHVSMALHSESAWVSGGGAQGETEKEIVNASLREAVDELSKFGTVYWRDAMAILSLVGTQMRNMRGVAGKMFSVLGSHGVNIEMISQGASEINISCVIEERDADRAINILHTNLFTFLD